MTRIVLTHWVHDEVLDLLRPYGQVVANPGRTTLSREEVLARAGAGDALVAFMPDRIDDAFLARCPRLRVVAGALKGADNIDVAACTERGVWVTVVPDLLTEPTAELAVALLLALLRNVPQGDRHVRAGGYAGWRPVLYGGSLTESRVGILGMGAVGRATARRLRGFGCEIAWCDPAVGDGAAGVVGTRLDLPDLLRWSERLVVAAPLTPETFRALDAASLRRLPAGAYVVNVGRGSVVDESAVAAALAAGRLAGYAADVFACEDLSLPDRPREIPPELLALGDRTVFTPHLGSAVDGVRRAIAMAAARSVVDVLEGRAPSGAVNRPEVAVRA